MRRPFIYLVLLLSLCFTSVSHSSVITDTFQYTAELKGNINSNRLYQIHLSGEIFAKCASRCRDIRLIGPNNSEIPYVILQNMQRRKVESYDLKVINYEKTPPSEVITLKLPSQHEPVSILELDIADRDFERKIHLYGSNDQRNWVLLKEDRIYDFSSKVTLRKTDIKFNQTNYSYYRIHITNDKSANIGENINLQYKDLQFSVIGGANDKSLRIDRFTCRTTSKQNSKGIYDEVEFAEFVRNDNKEGITEIILKSDLPASKIYFDVSNPLYYRVVDIYGSDSGDDDSFKFLKTDYLYRFMLSGDKETKNYVSLHTAHNKYNKFVIKNKDNPPLEVKSIIFQWPKTNLYFMAIHQEQPYALYFGNPDLDVVVYDLARFIQPDKLHTLAIETMEISPVRNNPSYKKPGIKFEKGKIEKTVLTLIVSLLIIGIGCWLYVLLRKTSNPDSIK